MQKVLYELNRISETWDFMQSGNMTGPKSHPASLSAELFKLLTTEDNDTFWSLITSGL